MQSSGDQVAHRARFFEAQEKFTQQGILDLLAAGRSGVVDWLPGRAPVSDIAAMLAAMANARGGTLLLGVAPRSDRPVGVDDAENAINCVLEAALSIEPPLIIPMPQLVQVHGSPMVVVQVPRGMPYVYALAGRFLRRSGTVNAAMTPADLRRLML